jgi:hypothetical protein
LFFVKHQSECIGLEKNPDSAESADRTEYRGRVVCGILLVQTIQNVSHKALRNRIAALDRVKLIYLVLNWHKAQAIPQSVGGALCASQGSDDPTINS